MRSLVLLLVLVGCAASGPDYQSVVTSSAKATVIVYRLEPYSLIPYTIALNGVDKCHLHREGYFSSEIDPGKTTVTTSYWSMPGTSKLTFDTKRGQIYYVRMTHNTGNNISTLVGGLIGEELYQGASEESGPMRFYLMNPAVATQEIKETSLDCQ